MQGDNTYSVKLHDPDQTEEKAKNEAFAQGYQKGKAAGIIQGKKDAEDSNKDTEKQGGLFGIFADDGNDA